MALTQHYGAVQGLAAMGPSVVRLLILPNLEPYLKLLEPEMILESQKNEIKRHEAWRVYGALLQAAGRCIFERVKLFPGLLSLSARSTFESATKVVTTLDPDATKGIVSPGDLSSTLRKRNASAIFSSQMSSKRSATDGSIASLSSESLAASMGATSECQAIAKLGESALVKAPGQNSDENITGSSRREKGLLNKSERTGNVLAQAWKEDVDAGQLLASLVDLFGEGMLMFVSSREMSLFL